MDSLWFKILFSCLFCCYIFQSCLCTDKCVTQCKETTFIGTSTETRGGRSICAYKGIRFAKPPIDDLRFKNPEYLGLQEGIVTATQDGQQCFQRALLSLLDIRTDSGGEDCLFLNVYACVSHENSYAREGTKLPVVVFIHGGGWLSGSDKQSYYGPEYLCDKDIVYVAMNYRLGFFGFMTSGDEYAPGNLGLKDMALALRWVHDNIACFGGDPDKVTLTGESVGAVSVTLLSVSPWAKNFFKSRVSFSGDEAMPVAFREPEDVVYPTKEVAAYCGCPTQHSAAMVACLQKCPPEIIMKTPHTLQNGHTYPPYVAMFFMPIIDKHVTKDPALPIDPRTLCTTKPWILGSSLYDGSYFVAHFAAYPKFLKAVLKNPCSIIEDLLYLYVTYRREAIPEVTDQICRYYFQRKSTNIRQLLKLFTDSFFFIPGYLSAERYKTCGKTYFYIDYYYIQSRQTWNDVYGPKGVLDEYIPGHSDVLSLFFATYALFDRTKDTELDVKISEYVIEYLYNFAKYGSPTPNNEHELTPWNTVGSEKTFNYLAINSKIQQKQNPDYETVQFWQKLNEKYGNVRQGVCECLG